MASRSAGDAGWAWEAAVGAGGLVDCVRRACDARELMQLAVAAHPPRSDHASVVIGKAAFTMAAAWEPREAGPGRCLLVAPVGAPGEASRRWNVLRGDHPIPSDRSVAAAGELRRTTLRIGDGELGENEVLEGEGLVVMLSGGASSLVCEPPVQVPLEELRELTRSLMRAGATIEELNTVRKHLDLTKGGRLIAGIGAYPIDVYVLSDVLGDDPAVIGSGPFAPDPTTYADAISVLVDRGCWEHAPAATAYLEAGAKGLHPETLKPGDPWFENVRTHLIGNNDTAVDAAAAWARTNELVVKLVQWRVQGEAREVGARLAREAAALPAGGAIVLGGETTVKITGGGHGGRNQELALAAAIELDLLGAADDVAVVTFGTDGVDGVAPEGRPPAAGALVTSAIVREARARGLDAAAYLERNDGYGFFASLHAAGVPCHVITGPTGTNVCDVAIAWHRQ
ncbi:MAG: glycerate kinase type-2 family protein [Phycisphaerales bacterium]